MILVIRQREQLFFSSNYFQLTSRYSALAITGNIWDWSLLTVTSCGRWSITTTCIRLVKATPNILSNENTHPQPSRNLFHREWSLLANDLQTLLKTYSTGMRITFHVDVEDILYIMWEHGDERATTLYNTAKLIMLKPVTTWDLYSTISTALWLLSTGGIQHQDILILGKYLILTTIHFNENTVF